MSIKKATTYGVRNTFPRNYCDNCGYTCEHPYAFYKGKRFCKRSCFEKGKEKIDATEKAARQGC